MVDCFAMSEGSLAHQKLSVYPKRTTAAIILVVFMALASARTMLVSTPPGGPDVTGLERRLTALRKALPQRGMVGYVSDTDSVATFFMTQYVLAPVVVYRGTGFATSTPGPVLVVGDFSSPASIPGILATNGLTVKRNFGDGVLLLELETR
jgi:hypothetical protein